MWLINILTNLQIEVRRPVPVYEENQACIMIPNNAKTYRTKHIDTRYHYLQELVKGKGIELISLSTKDQFADTLTKALPREAFERFRTKIDLEAREGDID